ncbi:MAG: NAD(P)-dependent oxidoreductase [Christensenellaceae bacterium]|nr:NAD(P)-dependent oxidoreductase [Christensenellaceae bacterium]
MKKIAFIGVGVMGRSMVRNLMKKGFPVSIYSRRKEKVLDVIADGAVWCDTIADCVKDADVVITMVGYPKDVEEVYFGEDAILANAKAGSYVIDMTTTSPKLSKRIYAEAKEKGIYGIDAPVSGGDVGAQKGTLAIMIGGDKEAVDANMDVFEAMGTSIVYEGGAGAGQHTKMANQIALGGAIAGVCEALAYAKAVGLDQQTMLDAISGGAAGSWQMSNMAPRMLAGNMDPGFFIKHYVKDLTIADEEASDVGVEMGVQKMVLDMYKQLEAEGYGDLGTQALIKKYIK